MAEELTQAIPLALAFGIVAFGWIEIGLNFSCHWNSNGDPGNGLGLPANLHLVAPAPHASLGASCAVSLLTHRKTALVGLVGAAVGRGRAPQRARV